MRGKPTKQDALLLESLIATVKESTRKAEKSLAKGLHDTRKMLAGKKGSGIQLKNKS